MKNYRFFVNILSVSVLLCVAMAARADGRRGFIRQYKDIAIREMERTGIPASITLAQGILESGCGESELAVYANNFFGIKCHDWKGETYTMDDDTRNECFRKYTHPEHSWIDHSEFLTSRPRYAGLFKLKSTDYKAWAKGLKAAGYATNPRYAELLIKIIEEEGLHRFDRVVKAPTGEDPDYAAVTTPPPAAPPAPEDNYHAREEMRNGILCIEARPGDNFYKIATFYGIKLDKLMQYNEKTDSKLLVGDIVYLNRKKRRAARGYEFHRVKPGDTMYDISQQYGVRLKKLYRNNYISEGSPLTEGEKIYLRKRAALF